MSVKTKQLGLNLAKALGLIFFLFLIAFNIKMSTSGYKISDINLLGLSLSVFTPSAIASEGGGELTSCSAKADCPPGSQWEKVECSREDCEGMAYCYAVGSCVTCGCEEDVETSCCE